MNPEQTQFVLDVAALMGFGDATVVESIRKSELADNRRSMERDRARIADMRKRQEAARNPHYLSLDAGGD